MEQLVILKENKDLQKGNQRLKIEYKNISKCDLTICKRTISEIITFIHDLSNNYTISQLFSALKFTRNTNYTSLLHIPSNKRQKYKEFS